MSVNDVGGRRRFEDSEYTLHIYPGSIAEGTIYCPIAARKTSTAAEVIDSLIDKLHLDKTKCYVLAEVKEFGGEEWILNPTDCPVQRMMLWPRMALENRISGEDYRFLLREKNLDGSIHYGSLQSWLRVTEERRRMVERGFLPQPQQKDYDDLCGLPDLNEKTLLENLRNRFKQEKIYTYVGSILIVINPFKFLPIYNPKYVKMYDNHQLGKLEPHIYAVADVAYHAMLQRKKNQCIVISGESGSGKTQSTNFLIHHLTALSQKGFASGVEQIILGAGPVLEAFGNAKTAHNNNSSRFGKFIQVNYQETGTVRGAYVEKYLLEKSRLVYQEHNERNYHVFYYLLAGASEEERSAFHLKQPEEYHYLNQDCFSVEGEDLKHDFERLQLAMEMVGFLPRTRRQIFSLLSAILHLGNIRYKKKTYRDDSIDICNPEILPVVSELLEVKEEMLFEALVTRKTVTVGEKLILPYKLAEAVTVRNSMAKSLYSALFDWIVFRINHALLNSKDMEESTKTLSIGVLDIFGFEDYENNSFEQFCINFANERLQHYFNQHIFKLEQEEYRAEGISWHNIDYIDNSSCINLISKKPTGLLHLLDEESNFPQATNQTLLDKFKRQHEGSSYIEFPAVMEPAFIIKHYAGKVKYGVKDFREKNTDHMRPDIVALLRSSRNAFICGMIGIDPVAVFRWAVLRAFFRAMVAFREAGKRYVDKKTGMSWPGALPGMGQAELLWAPCARACPPSQGSHPQCSLLRLHHLRKWCDGNIWIFYGFSRFPQHLLDVKSLKHLTNLTLHDRITKSLLHLHKKKKPPSISAQFQASLNKLMETLGQAEPYFVKCIRSNAEKLPLRFSDSLVLRQLRYTGMLETVRIRQSGYSCKYSFQDFVNHFHVLLPQGISPSKHNIHDFFRKIKLDPDNYQVGRTMVFMKERERQLLQDLLHQEVLRRITLLQRWFRSLLCRRQFLSLRHAAISIQVGAAAAGVPCQLPSPNPADRARGQNQLSCPRRELAIRIDSFCHNALGMGGSWTGCMNAGAVLPSKWEGKMVENNLRNKAVEREERTVVLSEVRKDSEPDQGKALEEEEEKDKSSTKREERGTVTAARALSPGSVIKRLEKLNVEKEERQKQLQLQNEREMMEQIRQQKEILERQRKAFEQQGRVEALQRTEQSRVKDPSLKPAKKPDSRPQSVLILHAQGRGEHSPSPGVAPAPAVDIKGLTVGTRGSSPAHSAPKERPVSMFVERREGLEPRCHSKPALDPKDHPGSHFSRTERLRQPRMPSQATEETRASSMFFTPKDNPFAELGPHHLTPPRSPELSGMYRREFKENKEPSPKVKRKRSVKISNVALEPVQWQNDSLQIITSASDLKSMDEFLLKKVTHCSIHQHRDPGAHRGNKVKTIEWSLEKSGLYKNHFFFFLLIRYKDLYALFEQILEKNMRLEQRDWSESPVKVWVNTFKVFLDEYMHEYKPLDYTAGKVEEHNGHIFKATQYSIPTYCEYCSSLIWIMDRASVLCKYACHKKCCLKTTTKCSKKHDPELSPRQFGVELSRLTSEERAVPLLVEKLINYIEMHGLYTEGIYRKSGSTNKIKELRQGLDTDIDSVNLDDYNIHVIASVFKQWLRDLPNPLMTFELYEEFLRVMGEQLPSHPIPLAEGNGGHSECQAFHSLFGAKPAEETNRMSANALAIVFAPCILRCPDTTDPLQSVQDISKTTTCVELIVIEQMNKYKARLKDINSLEFAENKAKSRLSLIRRSMVRCQSPVCPLLSSPLGLGWLCREELTFEMLTLEPRASDDETLESEASIGTADSSENLNFDSEGAISDRSGKSRCSWVYHGVVWVGRDLQRPWAGTPSTVFFCWFEKGHLGFSGLFKVDSLNVCNDRG
uniref:Myosin IXA n=1 Tax=Zonotrichia albicollis TaxID=44394 RepID=A0A8D2NGY7_ZONAL